MDMLISAMVRHLPGPVRHRLWLAHFRRHEQEIAFLDRFVPRGRTSVDVGAWKGGYTHHLARLSSHVYAYEPNPDLGAELRRRAAANVTVRGCALSDASGRAVLHVPLDPSGRPMTAWAQLKPGLGAAAPDGAAGLGAIEVETRRLDDEAVGEVGFIKVDVEGHERQVLEGALETIRAHRPVLLVELEQRHLGADLQGIVRWILSWGYRGWFLVEGRLNDVADFSYEEHQRPYEADLQIGRLDGRLLKRYANNFFFVPEDTARPADRPARAPQPRRGGEPGRRPGEAG